MQALFEMFAGLVAALAALALAQFGIDIDTPREQQQKREVHRLKDCGGEPATAVLISTKPARDC